MLRRLAAILAVAFVLPASAQAAGGDFVFDGAAPAERSTVRAALNASSFDWNVVPKQVTIHVGRYGVSRATPGHIWLDRDLLASGRFAWATVMDEYAHQVDFFVLDPARRSVLQQRLGASAWCYEVSGLAHSAHGCERFASMIAWAYWPSKNNAYRPVSSADESAAMAPGAFRELLSTVVGIPTPVSALISNR
ncbi:MAG TPA: hypothetical protein VFV62_09675 [Gaiellaceae bacterium]|nr:hypothetical protein [Gaiellaceae bacterium]